MQFKHGTNDVLLRGIQPKSLELNTISAKQLYKSTQGNDIWAFIIIEPLVAGIPPSPLSATKKRIFSSCSSSMLISFRQPPGLPPHRSHDHAIPLFPDAVPVNARPYHYSPQHKTKIEKQVKELLAVDLISHSHSPFASPVLLVKKKDDTWRFYVDYRKLNALTSKNRFPLPIVEEILDELVGPSSLPNWI